MLSAKETAELYGREYYANGCGPVPYERSEHWLHFFAMVADQMIRALHPTRVLDAGCAMGFLVEAFWDRGVYCEGIDISPYAISQVRRDIAEYCSVGSLTEPIPGKFDLVTCIEVLEHLPPDETRAAVENLCAVSDAIFFSSTPNDFNEPTHVNVRPSIYWLSLFSEFGFRPDAWFDASFLTPHAMLLKKASPSEDDFLRLFSESLRHKAAVLSRATAFEAAEAQLKELRRNYEQLLETTRKQTDEFHQLKRIFEESEKGRAALQQELEEAENSVIAFQQAEAQARAEIAALEQKVAEAGRAARVRMAAVVARRAQARAEVDTLKLANDDLRKLRVELQRTRTERDSVLLSPAWRLSGPIRGFWRALPAALRRGVRQGSKLLWWSVTFQLPARLQQRRALRHQLQLINASPLFNADWYRDEYPEIKTSGVDPALHYLLHGAAEGRNPGPGFDTRWYLESYPDVLATGVNPLLHYIHSGVTEGRKVQPAPSMQSSNTRERDLHRSADLLARCSLFNRNWYRDQYPDIAAHINPIDHYLRHGAAEGRNPGPDFDGNWYLERYPDVAADCANPLVHYLEHGVDEDRETRPVTQRESADSGRDGATAPTLERALKTQFSALAPLPTFLIPEAQPRLNIVTDSINSGSLYGGVGTSLIVSALLAERIEANLRLITRLQPAEVSNFGDVLSANGIPWEGNIEFLHSPPDRQREVPLSKNDVFLTTSWWTTRSVRDAVEPSRILYLLQEDERMFYPFGDERLRCEETLSDPDIQFVINSETLFEHLTTGPDALDSVRQHGTWFEPAFPAAHYYPETANRSTETKRNFFFYARPQNLRNLYWRGLEAIGAAIEEGILRPEEWDFYFVGRALDKLILPRDVVPTILENLPWAEYAALVRRMDLGLCLMDTPHSSYPPLDLAASGAVVVTNKRGLKTSLARYSDNILCAEPSAEALKNEIAIASKLACDDRVRFENYSRNRIPRDWRVTLEPVIQHLALMFRNRQS